MARPKRKEKDVERTRQDIIEAAARVFARRGFNDASMQDIAREAGYSAPSLYAYFEGKDAIFSGLVCLMAREFDQLFELTFPASLTFFQRLELLVLHHTQWADRRREAFFALMSLDLMGRPGDSARSQAQSDGDAAYINHLQLWLKQNARKGDLGSATHEEAAYALWGLSQAFFQRWLRSPGQRPFASTAARVVELFRHGITGAPKEQVRRTR